MDFSTSNKSIEYDVVVVGAGSAGVSAAISASRNGARTLLVESGSVIGGDLISGLPIDGCRSTCGEWIIGGIAQELFDECKSRDGYIASIFDKRNICIVIVDPRIMGFAILRKLKGSNVHLLPYTQAIGSNCRDGKIQSVSLVNKTARYSVSAEIFIDATGDGDIAVMSGAPYEIGGERKELQPISMTFQLKNIDPAALLAFVRDNPENCGLGENPLLEKSAKELAQELFNEGIPKVFFSGEGPLLQDAIGRGALYPCSMLAVNPNSIDGTCVTINSTRLVLEDCTSADALGTALLDLTDQVDQVAEFLKKSVPGFRNAVFNGISPRLGVRESRRIIGECCLRGEEVINAVKRDDGVCKGGHEIDVHGKDRDHIRATIRDAGSYDIPFGCLLPKSTANLLVAGRCLSSDRIANSSARVMGTCMGMGQAVGTAAALCVKDKVLLRNLSIKHLRTKLKEQGAILDGTR